MLFNTPNAQTIHDYLTLHSYGYVPAASIFISDHGAGILYSASGENAAVIEQQMLHITLAFAVLFLFAQIPPLLYRRWAVALYGIGIFLLIAVLFVGHTGKGAERWLNLGFVRFQPSEIMKLALPLFLASYFHKMHLPLNNRTIFSAIVIILVPAFLVSKQPDQSTAALLIIAGGSVLFLAGLSWRLLSGLLGLVILSAPLLWYFMHDYQRQRVLTFLNPERDPLNKSYHIIQSKIAIGSGGFFGKGWLNGTQSHLHFLPEHSTDFIFAVCGEEFGFLGSII